MPRPRMETQHQNMCIEAYINRRISRNPIIAAIYARANPVDRKFNVNVRLKVLACWNYCVDRGWKVEYIFVDQQEKADKTTRRRDFENIRSKANVGIFDVVVFWSFDSFVSSDSPFPEEQTQGYCGQK